MFLLDTNIISKLRLIGTARESAPLALWQSRIDAASMYISAISVMELEKGILGKERQDAQQGAVLRKWFNERVMHTFGDRILPFDIPVAKTCAHLHIPNPKSPIDALIGATAIHHNMTLVTANIKDFEDMAGISLLNPCA